MIDKFLYKFFGLLDTFSEYLDKAFFPKPRKKNCKLCRFRCNGKCE
jgi:hypothetical protein